MRLGRLTITSLSLHAEPIHAQYRGAKEGNLDLRLSRASKHKIPDAIAHIETVTLKVRKRRDHAF